MKVGEAAIRWNECCDTHLQLVVYRYVHPCTNVAMTTAMRVTRW